MAAGEKKARVKKVNYEKVERSLGPWRVLREALAFHPDLADASIVLMWRRALKPDHDGKLVLGKCKKASDLDRELGDGFDLVVILNQEAWGDLSPAQRLALVDHELCHAAVVKDETGEPKKDERGRKLYRIRKHDIEEFSAVIDRHGCYKADLEDFARRCAATRATPLFTEAANSNGDGVAAASRPRPARRR